MSALEFIFIVVAVIAMVGLFSHLGWLMAMGTIEAMEEKRKR